MILLYYCSSCHEGGDCALEIPLQCPWKNLVFPLFYLKWDGLFPEECYFILLKFSLPILCVYLEEHISCISKFWENIENDFFPLSFKPLHTRCGMILFVPLEWVLHKAIYSIGKISSWEGPESESGISNYSSLSVTIIISPVYLISLVLLCENDCVSISFWFGGSNHLWWRCYPIFIIYEILAIKKTF